MLRAHALAATILLGAGAQADSFPDALTRPRGGAVDARWRWPSASSFRAAFASANARAGRYRLLRLQVTATRAADGKRFVTDGWYVEAGQGAFTLVEPVGERSEATGVRWAVAEAEGEGLSLTASGWKGRGRVDVVAEGEPSWRMVRTRRC
ncbi:MAG: hypothetical protein AB1938_32225 [Myxococcota bacterium]